MCSVNVLKKKQQEKIVIFVIVKLQLLNTQQMAAGQCIECNTQRMRRELQRSDVGLAHLL